MIDFAIGLVIGAVAGFMACWIWKNRVIKSIVGVMDKVKM
jgi:hypothetical protein